MKVTIKLNQQKISAIENAVKKSALEAMEAVNKDLVDAMTMPFDTGNMQNGGTYTSGVTVNGNTVCDFSAENQLHIALTNDAPQARRLYYHPEYEYRQPEGGKNRGAYWLEPYISGNKKNFIEDEFKKALKGKI